MIDYAAPTVVRDVVEGTGVVGEPHVRWLLRVLG